MKSIYIFFACLSSIILSCDMVKDKGLKLRVNNTSDKVIYADWTTDYPDTSLNHVTNPTFNPQINKVEAKSIQNPYYGAPSRGIFDSNISKLSVFIFDANTLETTPWDTVRKKYMILKRYDLSLDDLEKMNWTITYP